MAVPTAADEPDAPVMRWMLPSLPPDVLAPTATNSTSATDVADPLVGQ